MQRKHLLRVLSGLDAEVWERTANVEGRHHSIFIPTRRVALHKIEHMQQLQEVIEKLEMRQ